MCEILIKINCPRCQSGKVAKNGKKRYGAQNLLCRCCRRQFQASYRNKGADPAVKQLIVRLLERNSGFRDIGGLLGVSRGCILGNLRRQGDKLRIRPAHKHYESVQVDEARGYVGKKKKGEYWLLYAYSPETGEMLAYTCGGGSARTVKRLPKKLKDVEIDEYRTDHWRAFAKVPPPEKHTVGKAYTRNIEGVNTCVRA